MELAPDTAVVIRDGEQKEVPVESVALGELILIKPGSRIPLDGIVVEGSTSVDESMLTGESIPVEKEKEDEVIGGSVNYQGAITVKVTHGRRTGKEGSDFKIGRYCGRLFCSDCYDDCSCGKYHLDATWT